MSQGSVIISTTPPLTGAALVTALNTALGALSSMNAGASAPTLGPGVASALAAGQLWLDTSTSPRGVKIYDSASWVQFGTLDASAHKFNGTFKSLALGTAGSTIGTLTLSGNTSGTVTVTPQAAAGSATLTLPTTTGTLVSSATSPLQIDAATGIISLVGGYTGGAWTSWTPTISSTGGSGVVATINAAHYVQIGKMVFYSVDFSITNNGTGSGTVTFTLPPVNAVTSPRFTVSGLEYQTTAKELEGFVNSSTVVTVVFYDGTYPGGSGSNKLALTGFYEAA